MIINEFRIQSSIQSVAQAVVNRICQMHRDVYSTSNLNSDRVEDMTLLIRNFNHHLVNGVKIKRPSRLSLPGESKITFDGGPLTITVDENDDIKPLPGDVLVLAEPAYYQTNETNTRTINEAHNDATMTGSTSTSSGFTDQRFGSERSDAESYKVDKDGKIDPYVDFSELTTACEQLKVANVIPGDFSLD